MDLSVLQGSRDYFSGPSESDEGSDQNDNLGLENEKSPSDDSDAEFVLERCARKAVKSGKCSRKRLLSPGKIMTQSKLEFKNYERAKKVELEVQYSVVARSTGSMIGEKEHAESSLENVKKYKLNVGLPQETYHVPLFGIEDGKK